MWIITCVHRQYKSLIARWRGLRWTGRAGRMKDNDSVFLKTAPSRRRREKEKRGGGGEMNACGDRERQT